MTDAFNVQGDLHLDGFEGRKRKKRLAKLAERIQFLKAGGGNPNHDEQGRFASAPSDTQPETLKVYHGTDESFSGDFDLSRGGANFGDAASKQGVAFFTENRRLAGHYGDNVIERQVSLQNPKRVDAEGILHDDYDTAVRNREFEGTFDSFVADHLEGNPYAYYEQGMLANDIGDAKAAGHDGLVIDFGSLHDSKFGKLGRAVVAFDTKQIKKAEFARTLYVHRPVLNADAIISWAKGQGFQTTVPAEELHVTLAYSRAPVDWSLVPPDLDEGVIGPTTIGRSVEEFNGGAWVLRFSDKDLEERWQQFIDAGASWDWPDYKSHITISFKSDQDPSTIVPYDGEIILGPEEFAEVQEDWKDNIVEKVGARHSKADVTMLQQMHDHAVSLGATCQLQNVAKDCRIAKVDESLGMVFGWAIVCKNNGEDYFDLNIDPDGERKPEHIPEDAMLKASAEFMENSRLGNEMHAGPDKGTYVFAFPMTSDIAKAFGIQTPVTGLMVAFKPPPEVLAKFVDGTYSGFSIEGKRLATEEIE